MGDAKRRGTKEQRVALAIANKPEPVVKKRSTGQGMFTLTAIMALLAEGYVEMRGPDMYGLMKTTKREEDDERE